MALLTDDLIERLQKLLVEEGLVEQAVLGDAVSRAAATDKPLFTLLSEDRKSVV